MVKGKSKTTMDNLSEDDRKRFSVIRERAKKLGILDINLSGVDSIGVLKCYEQTLDIIENNKEIFDQNAGESGSYS
jgi:hypothetical protein